MPFLNVIFVYSFYLRAHKYDSLKEINRRELSSLATAKV